MYEQFTLSQRIDALITGVPHPLVVRKREEIAALMRQGQVREVSLGCLDEECWRIVDQIVQLKLELDVLYTRWINGELD